MIAITWFWIVTTFLFGICFGSFLNVVIWRLPRKGTPETPQSLMEPTWSYCPTCNHSLNAKDLVPLISYLCLRRRCHYCEKPISSRYFWVELLTGVLFVVMYFRYRDQTVNAVAMLAFMTVLVPIYFIDFEHFIIPDSLNLMAFVIAIGRDVWGIATHETGHALMWGWLPPSILGAVVGTLIFGFVRVVGWLWKRQEAMGLGDVYLARAMGAMLVSVVPAGLSPLRLFPIWVILACGSGAVVGPALIWYRRRLEAAQSVSAVADQDASAEEDGDESDGSNLKRELLDIGEVLWLADAVLWVKDQFHPAPPPAMEEDDWTPAPSAIPFGPFMILGFLATVLVGEHLTAMYLAYALPKITLPGPPH